MEDASLYVYSNDVIVNVGSELREDYTARERPVLLLRREVHPGKARGLRQAENRPLERNPLSGEHLRIHESPLRLRPVQVRYIHKFLI